MVGKASEFLNSCVSRVPAMCLRSEVLKDEEKYEELKQQLETLLEEHYDDVEVHFFGSRIIGLADDKSDLDIFVEIDGNFNSKKNVKRDRKIIAELESILREDDLWKVDVCIDKTKVPIIKATYRPDKLKCDISVSNGLGVMNSLMIRHLFELQPEAIKLFHFLNIFLPRYAKTLPNISEVFSGYLLKLMVLFYLQSEDRLPSAKKVQRKTTKEFIDGWEVQCDSSRSIDQYDLKKMRNYKNFVRNFFNFYGEFDYENNVMSTYKGIDLSKEDYKYTMNFTDEFSLSIYGPLNQEHNIARNLVSNQTYDKFASICKGLYSSFFMEHHWNAY